MVNILKKLSFSFFIICNVISCHSEKGQYTINSQDEKRDSALRLMVTKYSDLPQTSSNTLKFSNFYTLKKSIFNNSYDVKLELLVNYSGSGGWDHKVIYISNNKNLQYAFPLIDNFNIWKSFDINQNQEFSLDSVIMERELNHVLKTFKIGRLKNSQIDLENLSVFLNDFFVSLLDNEKIYSGDSCRLRALANFIKYKSPSHQSKTRCQKNVLSNIDFIIDDLKDTLSWNKRYFTNDHFSFYQLTYPTQVDTSQQIKIRILNSECYFKMLY